MSTITINGERVVSGSITFPHCRVWTADVLLAGAATLGAAATIVVGDLTCTGTIVRQGSFAGSPSARIVGGKAGWRKVLPAKGYSHRAGVKLSTVVSDAARETGETVVVSADRTIGNHYVREGAQAERVLHTLLNGEWYVTPDGVTRTAARDASRIATPFTVESWSGARGQFEIATEAIAQWQPGRTFTASNVPDVQEIGSVTITVDNSGKLRLTVLNGDGDRLRGDLRNIVRSEVPSLTYAGVWEYTIVSGDDETVDVTSTDPRMPSITNVPMRPGLMGEVVTPTPGSKCRIMFVNSSPMRPECVGIIGSPIKVEICNPLPTQASARFGDAVSGTAITLGSTKVFVGG